jgi:hypothetical protein
MINLVGTCRWSKGILSSWNGGLAKRTTDAGGVGRRANRSVVDHEITKTRDCTLSVNRRHAEWIRILRTMPGFGAKVCNWMQRLAVPAASA